MADDVQRLILQVEGEERLKSLNAQLATEKDWLKELLEINRSGMAVPAPGAIDASAQKMVLLNQQISELNRSTRRLSGNGLLQLQYVMDDLVNTSGNWERHLSSISNNIPGLVSSLGLGAGVAGAVGLVSTALIALAPVAKEAWNAIAGDAPELAKEKLKEIRSELEKIHKEFTKLAEHPSSAEETAAKGAAEMFGERPTAEKTAQALARNFSAKDIRNALNDEEKNKLLGMGAYAQMTDAQIAAEGEAAAQKARAAGWGNDDVEERRQREIAYAKRMREQHRPELDALTQGVRRREAERLVGAAAKPGPDTASALSRIQSMAAANPTDFPRNMASDLGNLSPDAIDRDNSEADAWLAQTEEWSQQGKTKRERVAREKRAKAEADRKAKADARLAESLTDQGAAIEDRMRAAELREGQAAQRDMAHATAARIRRGPADEYAHRLSDFNQANRAGLGDSQIQAAAAQAVQMVRAGADTNDALMSAFMNQIQQMQQLQQRLQMQAARARGLMMGSDASGNFSQIPPGLGY